VVERRNAEFMVQDGGGGGNRPEYFASNARSLHCTDHRFAMICSGRDDRIERYEP
jgi:hypothetical protein